MYGNQCVAVEAQKCHPTFAEHLAPFDGRSFVIPQVEFVQSFLYIQQLTLLLFACRPTIAVHSKCLVGNHYFVEIPRQWVTLNKSFYATLDKVETNS